jgi:hypothetical protein
MKNHKELRGQLNVQLWKHLKDQLWDQVDGLLLYRIGRSAFVSIVRQLEGQFTEYISEFSPTKEQRNKAWELLNEVNN